jgi:uncharacterized protein YoxC
MRKELVKLTYISWLFIGLTFLLLLLYIYVFIKVKRAIDHQQSLNEHYSSEVMDHYKKHLLNKNENIDE